MHSITSKQSVIISAFNLPSKRSIMNATHILFTNLKTILVWCTRALDSWLRNVKRMLLEKRFELSLLILRPTSCYRSFYVFIRSEQNRTFSINQSQSKLSEHPVCSLASWFLPYDNKVVKQSDMIMGLNVRDRASLNITEQKQDINAYLAIWSWLW